MCNPKQDNKIVNPNINAFFQGGTFHLTRKIDTGKNALFQLLGENTERALTPLLKIANMRISKCLLSSVGHFHFKIFTAS